MANSYTRGSVTQLIPRVTIPQNEIARFLEAQRDWLDVDYPPATAPDWLTLWIDHGGSFEPETHGSRLYLYFEESFGDLLLHLLELVLAYLPEQGPDRVSCLTVHLAHTSDRLYPRSHGGAALLITRTSTQYMDTMTWVHGELQRLGLAEDTGEDRPAREGDPTPPAKQPEAETT